MNVKWSRIVMLGCLGFLVSCDGGNTKKGGNSQKQVVEVKDSFGTFQYTTTTSFKPIVKPMSELSEHERGLFLEINKERRKGGECTKPTGEVYKNPPAEPLKFEARIYKAAKKHAENMINDGFAGHINHKSAQMNMKTPVRRMVMWAGYTPSAPLKNTDQALFFEENLAYGYFKYAEVVQDWIKESFTHCMTIYEPLSYGAVAVLDGNDKTEYKRYWVLNVSGVRKSK